MTLTKQLQELANSSATDEDRLQVLIHLTAELADRMEPPCLEAAPNSPEIDFGEVTDGFHSFNQLYAHRNALFLALMSAFASASWISTLHHDGTSFEGFFIAGMDLGGVQISYHLPAGDWSLACDTGAKIWEKAPEWDGHTSDMVVERLRQWVAR